METDTASCLSRPLHFLWAGLFAIGFLGLVLLILPEPYSMSPIQMAEQSEPRQHVLVLVIDSTDLIDAHGEYVHSVIRQYCGACEVRQINVHGNMSTSRLQLALEQAREMVVEVDHKTSVIINLSWGTYTYNAAIHDAIRGLQKLGAVMIASAGNDNTSKPFYPAAFHEVLGARLLLKRWRRDLCQSLLLFECPSIVCFEVIQCLADCGCRQNSLVGAFDLRRDGCSHRQVLCQGIG